MRTTTHWRDRKGRQGGNVRRLGKRLTPAWGVSDEEESYVKPGPGCEGAEKRKITV